MFAPNDAERAAFIAASRERDCVAAVKLARSALATHNESALVRAAAEDTVRIVDARVVTETLRVALARAK